MTSVVLLLALGLTWAVPSVPPDYPTQDKTQEELANVEVYYQNGWDQDLHVECAHGQAIYKFQSIHDNRREDRKWRFDCKSVS